MAEREEWRRGRKVEGEKEGRREEEGERKGKVGRGYLQIHVGVR